MSTPVDNSVDSVWTARLALWNLLGAPVDRPVGDTPGTVAAPALTSDNGGAHDVEESSTAGSDEDRVTSQHAGTGPAPVAVLRRIAFLLERRLADSYRIKAYRGAAS